jgi:PspA-Associated protein
VRGNGAHLADDELSASDHIFPPADISFPEAGEEFTGDGLIPESS